jgi:hypothetical protein
MTYKWEAIAQDLTEERDKSRVGEPFRSALTAACAKASAALKSEKQ